MGNPGKIRLNKKGAALITVYMVIAVLLAFGGFVVDVSNSQNKTAKAFKQQIQVINSAEASLDRALVWMRNYLLLHGTYPPESEGTNIESEAFPLGCVPPFCTGRCTVDFSVLASPSGMYRVRSIVTVGTVSQTVINYLQPDNYARYIWFTDGESYGGTNVWFWDQDHLNGPTHTNGHFNIKGNPVFEGEVRSVDNYIKYFNNGTNIDSFNLSNPPYDLPDFQDTVTLGSKSIKMPTQALSLRSAASSSGGLYLTGDTTIVLNSNGTMDLTNNTYCNNCTTTCDSHGRHCQTTCTHTCPGIALPGNGALFVNNGTLTISGTLSGRLTAGASGDINITNNIIYANNPRTNPASTDTLGLISEGDVMIDSSAPNNLEVDASIMALNTSFMLEDWWTGGAKGTLTVFGGIIQKQRGPVGTFSGTTKVSGYSKNYNYDERLLSSPPPFVPTTGDYITVLWEEPKV